MTELNEIEAKLLAAREEVKRLVTERDLRLAFNKVKLPLGSNLSQEMESAVSKVVEKYLGQGQVKAVLTPCHYFMSGVQKLRRDNLDHLRRKQVGPPPKRQRGRPKGSINLDAKELINDLAVIWQETNGELPKQFESRFGEFVKEIAKALQIKDANGHHVTWSGLVNEILNDERYARIRAIPNTHISIPHSFDSKLELVANEDWEERITSRRALFKSGFAEGIEMAIEEIQIKNKIKVIPGTDKFDVTTTTKTS